MRPNQHSNARQRWRRWTTRIKPLVRDLLLENYKFQRFVEVTKQLNLRQELSDVYHWIGPMYAKSVTVGIRRLVEDEKDTYSLRSLLKRICNNPQVITRESYRRRFPKALRNSADNEFCDLCGSNNATSLPRTRVESDLDKLVRIHTRIVPYVNQRVLHLVRHPRHIRNFRWSYIHNSIERIEQIFLIYDSLLHSAGRQSSLLSSFQRQRFDEQLYRLLSITELPSSRIEQKA